MHSMIILHGSNGVVQELHKHCWECSKIDIRQFRDGAAVHAGHMEAA